MIQYKIVEARIVDDIRSGAAFCAEKVEKLLDEGWELVGGASLSAEYICQALILNPDGDGECQI